MFQGVCGSVPGRHTFVHCFLHSQHMVLEGIAQVPCCMNPECEGGRSVREGGVCEEGVCEEGVCEERGQICEG